MPEYHLYTFDQHGHIRARRNLTLPDDQQAIATAKQFLEDRALELWSGADLIARILPGRNSHDGSLEFLGSDASERAKKCREFAADAAEWAAKTASTDMQTIYLDLSRHWTMLADQLTKRE